MDSERLAAKHIVLIGIGHTNAHIVRMWRMHRIPDTDLTCISDNSTATYSGMLPAALAGQIRPEQMEIDLVRLCSSVGARLIVEKACGIDHQHRQVLFADRPPVPFDLLSIGIGSVPTTAEVEVDGESLIKIKPMQSFRHRLAARVRSVLSSSNGTVPLQIVVVGSGVAGIEIAFCLSPFLRKLRADKQHIRLVTRSDQILPEVASGTRDRIGKELAKRGIQVMTGHGVVKVSSREVQLDDGRTLEADLVIWATGASAPPSLEHFGLPSDARGFIATDHSLRCTSGEPIFAVGDSGTIVGENLPKAGVYAVRQGPVLWENMRRYFRDQQLVPYRPQRSFLKLINLGDGRAVGEWKGLSFSGSLAYWLKHQIDSKFMDKFRPISMAGSDEPMQCRGCGCKLGSAALDGALGFSESTAVASPDSIPASEQGIQLEDAAEVGGDGACKLLASTDFFSNPFDDSFLAGRVAAIHAASDILATGACVTEALANVVVPEGDAQSQQRMLRDFLAGARREFDALGARVVGGHTIVGPRMEVGFTVIGRPIGEQLLRKSGLRAGDALYLTKPLGVGVLLAAHMRAACHAADYERMIESMLQSQAEYARLAVAIGLTACTDITGFGLAGHLLEMLDASRLGATLHLADLPILSGAEQAVANGIESSLFADNLRATSRIMTARDVSVVPKYRLLFDPQTCGGLLLAVPSSKERELASVLNEAQLPAPARVGEVTSDDAGRIQLV